MTGPVVSVVVCCFNGAAGLPATLVALSGQTLARVEVIVVDDGSSDDTAMVAASMGVRVIRHPENRGLAAARNTGWKAAAAGLVAFTDDDCRPEPDWLSELVAGVARHPGSAGFGGSVDVCGADGLVIRYLQRDNPLTPLDIELLAGDGILHRLALYLRRSRGAAPKQGERAVSSVVGANMAFPVESLEAAGGFDERFRFGAEEEDLCRRLIKAGRTLHFISSARVQHEFESGIADTLRRSRAYGRGNARMFLKHDGLRLTFYPLPVLIALLVALGIFCNRVLAATAALSAPLVLFSRWPREAVTDRAPELLTYPYLQLAQETWGNVGLLQGLWQMRGEFGQDVEDSFDVGNVTVADEASIPAQAS